MSPTIFIRSALHDLKTCRIKPGRLLLGLLGLSLLCQAGCSTPSKTVTLPTEPPPAFSKSGSQAVPVPEQWWTVFEDSTLNTVIDTAFQSNFNLKTAWQRLRASQSVVERESSLLFPDLEGSVQGGISRALNEFQDSENITLGLSSVYELDLWGRIHSGIDAERYRAMATRTDYQTAALSLSAEIVRTWFRLAEARNEVELIQQQINTNESVLKLLESRFGSGQIRSVDILRQRQLVESTKEQRSLAESDLKLLEHRIAVLLGQVPQKELAATPDELPRLPPLPGTGIPVDLIRRRPDVQSAFNRLKASDRDLAAAINNQYPRLTLSASVSSGADNAENLFEQWALSFTGNLIAPILYGGELRAEVDRLESVKKQRLYEYGQTILTAFQEVEDALVLETKQRESLESLKKQLDLARQAYEQLRVEYLNGTSNYLDVLTSLDEVQQIRRDLLTARLNLVEYRIALYRALAGPVATPREQAE